MAGRRWFTNRALFQVHGWIGLNLGLLLFVVCFSGAIASVSHEIEWLLNPAMRVTPPGDGAPIARWTDWHNAVAAAHPGARILAIDAPEGPWRAARATVAYSSGDWRFVFVDPYTARVTGTFSEFGIARFFRSFHKQLYIYPGQLPHGVYAVGPLGVVLLVSLGTGLAFYRFRWRDLLMRGPWRNARAFWSALHRATGMWTVPVAVLITATGVWYLVERGLQDGGIQIPEGQTVDYDQRAAPAGSGPWPLPIDEAVAAAERAVAGFRVESVAFGSGERPLLTLTGQSGAWLVRDDANRVRVDPYAGRIDQVHVAASLPAVARLSHTADPLHFGTFGGLATKILWLVVGLFMSSAILLGVRLWYLRVTASMTVPARVRMARLGVMTTVLVLAVSAYGSVVNIGAALDHHPTARYSPIGQVRLGSLTMRLEAAMVDGTLFVVAHVPDGPGRARVVRAWAWADAGGRTEAVEGVAVPMAAGWYGLTAAVETRGQHRPSRLWLAVDDRSGERVVTHVPIGDEVLQPSMSSADGLVPLHAWVVVVLFVALTGGICIGWFWWVHWTRPQSA